jgi:hypothetical protein
MCSVIIVIATEVACGHANEHKHEPPSFSLFHLIAGFWVQVCNKAAITPEYQIYCTLGGEYFTLEVVPTLAFNNRGCKNC